MLRTPLPSGLPVVGLASGPVDSDLPAASHLVQFYDDDAFITDAVAAYISDGLRDGAGGIVVATPAHRTAIAERLCARGVEPEALAASGRYMALDAAETLARCVHNGAPDPNLFVDVIGGLVQRSAAGRRGLRVFGEMVALLVASGNPAAALQMEELWNGLQRRLQFSLLCAYPMGSFGDEARARLLASVCDAHSQVIPAESFTAIESAEAQMRTIAILQQKAAALEAEVRERERVQERLETALAAEQSAHAAAEAAARARVDFLSIASHELRTPLTSLLGYAQAMLRRVRRGEPLSPEGTEQTLALVMNRGALLARLLNQLLDVAQLEAGTLALDRGRTDVAALVRAVVAQTADWSDRHAIRLDAPAPLTADVDAGRIERTLLALIENAVRYSPDGGPIDVTLRALPAELEISIRDHGLGIPLDQRARVFQPFFQAHRDDHRSGVGLGLYLSRRIVEMHGGRLDASFPGDGGLCVTLHLPLDDGASTP